MSEEQGLSAKIDVALTLLAGLEERTKRLDDHMEKFQDHCRDDMRSVYLHVNSIEDAMDERMRQVEAHAQCQKGKAMSWDKMVLIGTAVFVFFQAMAAWWPKI